MNIREAHEKFGTDEQCLQYIENMRWPDGIVRCPTCGDKNVAQYVRPIPTKRRSKQRDPEKENKRQWFYICRNADCRQQFSPTAGTIFHDTHLPLIVWFHAIAIMLNAKKGISAKQLQRHLGVNYRTVWYLAHRIRKAMEENTVLPLAGIVEVDETYIGGKYDRRRKRGPWEKTPVVGLLERSSGKARMMTIPTASKQVLVGVVKENVAPESRLLTDENPGYKTLGTIYRHQTVNHTALEYVRGDVHTNSVEGCWSLLKRGIIGSFHQVSVKHLNRYLAEFSYRFSRRQERDLFLQTLLRMTAVPGMSYQQLIAK